MAATDLASSAIEELLELANVDPTAVLAEAERRTEAAEATGDTAVAAATLRVSGLALAYQRRLQDAAVTMDRALALAEEAGVPALTGEVQMTRAGVLAWVGDDAGAHEAMTAALDLLEGPPRERALAQRGSISFTSGRLEDARRDLEEALPGLVAVADELWEAHTRMNLGLVLGQLGDLDAAASELELARAAYDELGHDLAVGEAQQNLGWLAVLRGDLPAAFALLDEAESTLSSAGSELGAVWRDRCAAMIAAHFSTEAKELASVAEKRLGELGYAAAQAETLVRLAEAALLDEDPETAVSAARRARTMLRAQAREAGSAYADLLALRALRMAGEAPGDSGVVEGIAATLTRLGFHASALDAMLIAGDIALAAGDLPAARRALAGAAPARKSPSLGLRVRGWAAEARLRSTMQNRRGASSAARAGLRAIARDMAVLGALEARAQLASYAEELGNLGLQLARDGGRPSAVLDWMERVRAVSLQLPPVRPPDDAELARLLEQLRRTESMLREATLAGDDPAGLRASSVALQRRIRRVTLRLRGDTPVPGATSVSAVLRCHADDVSFVAAATSGGRTEVVVTDATGHRRGAWPPADEIGARLDHLRFALGRLARSNVSAMSREASRAAAAETLGELDRALFADLGLPEVGPVVIAPPPELFTLPWGLLPSLAGRSVTVAPSLRLWLDRQDSPAHGGRTVVAGGPRLPGAARETRMVAAVHGDVVRFTPAKSQVAAVLAALDGASVAHVVAHGSFRADNPLFSSLELADGALTVYDLDRVVRIPPVIVLSACNSGIQAVRPGNETMGLVTGLLAAGCRTVIASTGLVPDTTRTATTMVELHRGLARGDSPAAALAAAQASALRSEADDLAAAMFVCFGTG